MAGLGAAAGPSVIVGTETGDDAGVVRLDDERALVLTADFITPPIDDPRRYGEIAAANSLSDVYAMGGRPIAAVALCAFPKELDLDVAHEILAGGQAKAAEAGAAIVGGHTVRNPELFYGLSVTGLVHPERVVRNVGARPGDALVLTKPLGTGLLINGRRKGLGSDEHLAAAVASMVTLNRLACEAALASGVHAMTDVTGFGLAGHALKMALGASIALRLDAGALPLLDGALALARQGVTTASTRSNRAAVGASLRAASSDDPSAAIAPLLDAILHDPQTSGGLLVAVPEAACAAFLRRLADAGVPHAARIGEVVASEIPFIDVRGDWSRFAE